MKLILLNLIVLCAICNIQALLFERTKRFKYDDHGEIKAACEKYCKDPVEKQKACSKYKDVQNCVEKLNEIWVHNTMKTRLSYCKPRVEKIDIQMNRCHERSAEIALAIIAADKTPDYLWEVRQKLGEDTLEFIQ